MPLPQEIEIAPDDLNDFGLDLHIKANEALGAVLIQYHWRAPGNLVAEAPPNNKGLIF